MERRFLRLLLLGALVPQLIACDRLFGPSDYDDCVLQSMKGVNSDLAARAIAKSCREKFPKKKIQDSELPVAALSRLTGHGGMGYSGFSGNIYNGNSDWSVTQVTIMLVAKGKEKSAEEFLNAKEYNVDVSVAPLTSSSLFFSADGPTSEEYSWNIVKARGVYAQ